MRGGLSTTGVSGTRAQVAGTQVNITVDHWEDWESSVKVANQGISSRRLAQDNLLEAALLS